MAFCRRVRRLLSSPAFTNVPLDRPLPNAPIGNPVGIENLPKRVTHVTLLDSGLKIATEDALGQHCTIGAMVDFGPRYEVDVTPGVSHFLSKLAFQRSKTWPSRDSILEELDKNGGLADCQYHRDAFMYALTGFSSSFPSLLRVLSESLFQPIVTAEDIDSQREEVQFQIEELQRRLDPEPLLTELIHAAAYRNNTLGFSKFCPSDSVDLVSEKDVLSVLKRYFVPSRITVCGVGVQHDSFVETVHETFSGVTPAWEDRVVTPTRVDESVSQYTGGIVTNHSDSEPQRLVLNPLPELAHVAIGFEAASFHDPDFFPFSVLNVLLGGGGSFSAGGPGKGMYSRLYTDVLNRYHWVQNATAYHHSYSDSGLFCIYGSASPNQLPDLVQVLMDEFMRLSKPYGSEELSRAKKQLQSMLMMNLESRTVVFEDIGRQILATGKRRSPEELCDRIESVTSSDIQMACQKMMTQSPAVAAFGNLSDMPSYGDIDSAFAKGGRLPGQSNNFFGRFKF